MLISYLDHKTHRIPNKLSLLLFVSLLASTLVINPSHFFIGVEIAAFYFFVFLGLYVFSDGALGFGDVKYAISCGFVIGVVDAKVWLDVIWLMFILAGVFGLIRIMAKKVGLMSAIAFAPFMTASVFVFSLNSLH